MLEALSAGPAPLPTPNHPNHPTPSQPSNNQQDGDIQLFSVPARRLVASTWLQGDTVNALALLPGGEPWVLLGCESGSVRVVALQDGAGAPAAGAAPVAELALQPYQGRVLLAWYCSHRQSDHSVACVETKTGGGGGLRLFINLNRLLLLHWTSCATPQRMSCALDPLPPPPFPPAPTPPAVVGEALAARGGVVALAVTRAAPDRPLLLLVHRLSGALVWDLRSERIIAAALDDEDEASKPTCACWVGGRANCFALGYDDGSVLVWGVTAAALQGTAAGRGGFWCWVLPCGDWWAALERLD